METSKCKTCRCEVLDINPKTNKPFYRCSDCRIKRLAVDQARKQAGVCRDCGGPAGGKARCLDCNRKAKELVRLRGLCLSCGGEKKLDGSLCERCILKSTARKQLGDVSRWTELQILYHEQDGKCAVTQKPIQLGVNSSIDHIIPRSRGGSNDISNLRWVHIVFNRMKSNLMDSELIEWVETILSCKTNLQV